MKKISSMFGVLLGLHRPFVRFFSSAIERKKAIISPLKNIRYNDTSGEMDLGPGKIDQIYRGGIIFMLFGFAELFLVLRAYFDGLGLVFALVFLSLPIAMFSLSWRLFQMKKRLEERAMQRAIERDVNDDGQ